MPSYIVPELFRTHHTGSWLEGAVEEIDDDEAGSAVALNNG